MTKTILLLLALLTVLSACGGKKGTETVSEAPLSATDVGPYAVDFSNDTKTYQHHFNIKISQDEGKVEYNILTSESVDIELITATLQVTGCSAGQVLHQVYWIPDTQKTVGSAIRVGASFKTIANTQGTVMHSIRGLTGCESVDLKTSLHQKPKAIVPARKCKESSDLACKVEMYCTEPGYSYTEVEVWKESFGTTLRKYNVSSSGTRSLSGMDTVVVAVSGHQVNYRAASNNSSLSVNTANGVSVYTIYAAGQSFPLNLTCQSYL